jgi:hypothetical protein
MRLSPDFVDVDEEDAPDQPPGGRSWLAWLAIAIGGLWALATGMDINQVMQTRHWPVVAGEIRTVAIRSDTVATWTMRRVGYVIEPRLHISYDYEVNGSRFTGTRFSILAPSKREASASVARSLTPGHTVSVHHDPADPTVAVIDTAIPPNSVLQVVVALILACGTWWASRQRARATTAAV